MNPCRRVCKEPILIDAEPTHAGKKPLKKKPYKGPILPPHLNTLQLTQGFIGNCWFLSAFNSILAKFYGPKVIASMMIDLETKLIMDGKLISLGKLLGLDNDKKVMIRLIKDGLPRYCIVEKSEILNAGQDRSDFYIQAIVKAIVSLFFEGDYSKVTARTATDGYRALLFGEAKELSINFKNEYHDAKEQYKSLGAPLSDEHKDLIFGNDTNLIHAFHLSITILRAKDVFIDFSMKNFSAACARTNKIKLGLDSQKYQEILNRLEKYESFLFSEEKYFKFFSENILIIIKKSI